MIYITQLIFIFPGQESVFDEFESHAIPLISKYNGKLEFRIRPATEAYIGDATERPYEVHFVSFESEEDFQRFLKDEERKKFLDLKDKSVRSSILVKGDRL